MFFRSVGEAAPKSKSFKSRVAFAACGKLPAEAVIRPGTNPLIHSILCKFSRLLFACAPLLLVAVALVPAAPADAVGICFRTQQVQEAIMAKTGIRNCAGVLPAHLSTITKPILLSSITTLQAGDFSGLSNLKILNLYKSQLTSLPKGVFSGLDSLTHLYLRNSQLTSLPKGVFSGLGSLKSLNLENNKLQSLPSGVFGGLDSLTYLNLENNKLQSLPSGVFGRLGSLTSLNLKNNALMDLPSGVFVELSGLRKIYLESNALTSLPKGVFSGLGNLTYLNLENNKLQSLPSGVFDGLSSLRNLYLKSNALTSLPKGVFSGLGSLAYLNLNNNKLKNLPSGVFGGLNGLTHLYLQNNALTNLPKDEFNDLHSLTHLHLDNNPGADRGWIWIDGESREEVIPDPNPPPTDVLDGTKNLYERIKEIVLYEIFGKEHAPNATPLMTEGMSNGKLPVTVGGDDEGVEVVGNGSGVSLVDNDGASDDLIELLEKIKPARFDDKKWLFVIGAEDYKNTDSIVYSRRSAERFVEVASKVFGIKSNRRVVLLEGATGGAIEDQLKAMLRKVRKGESIYFYYSGHGIPIRNSVTRKNTPYMLAIDHEPSLIEEKRSTTSTTYTIS